MSFIKNFFFTILLSYLLANSAFSEIKIDITNIYENGCSKVNLSLRNISLDPINDLLIEATLLNKNLASFSASTIRSNEERVFNVLICEDSIQSLSKGHFPLLLKTSYFDAKMLWHQLLDVVPILLGRIENLEKLIDLHVNEDGLIKIVNTSDKHINVKLNILINNNSLNIANYPDLSLFPKQEKQLYMKIETSVPDFIKNLPAFVILQFENNGRWQTIIRKTIPTRIKRFFGLNPKFYQMFILLVLVNLAFILLCLIEGMQSNSNSIKA